MKKEDKQLYLFGLTFVLVGLVISIIWDNYDYNRKKQLYKPLLFKEEYKIEVNSRVWDDKWFIVNDSFTPNAISINEVDSIHLLSDYILVGDILYKNSYTDTVKVIRRGQRIMYFIPP